MPEDPEKYDALTRYARRERIKTILVALAFVVPLMTLLGVFLFPEQEVSAPETARVISTAMEASDDAPPRRMINVELEDGRMFVLTARPLAAPSPGDMLCVTRVKRPLLGRVTLRLARPDACEAQ